MSEGAGATRAGGGGLHNEDAFLVRDALGLYAVCDGASAGPAGERAADLALAAVEDLVSRAEAGAGPEAEIGWGVGTERVEAALRHAMRAMLEAERLAPEPAGVDTSATLLLVRGSRGVFGHVGDSRAYLLRRGRVHPLTRDHALALAPREAAEPDARMQVFSVELEPSDRVVLCTDGAEAVVADPALARAAPTLSPAVLASRIASSAHRRDPEVDATAVVVRLAGEEQRAGTPTGEPEAAARHRVRVR